MTANKFKRAVLLIKIPSPLLKIYCTYGCHKKVLTAFWIHDEGDPSKSAIPKKLGRSWRFRL
ncbi:hypothetical protein AT237_07880 [Bartonella henselae]|nr:hypothetical protein AT237_07880 [Bartonella henselae]OLL41149.1 hypothetical protein AT244_00170 [Bartonella henselae]OLL45256.1 hypothetical protein AT245_07645 [Bartonella henselae]